MSLAGSSLWTVLDMLRGMQHHFPQVDVKYDPDSPSNTPIILHVRPHLDLLFSGQHQRLHTICLRKLRDPYPPVTLRYKDTILSSSEETLRRLGVSRTFGPTYPGDDLRYPGVWFSFEEDNLGEGLKSSNAHPEDRMQEVKRVIISQKGLERDALDEVIECPAMFGEVLRAIVKVRLVPIQCQSHNPNFLGDSRRRQLVLPPSNYETRPHSDRRDHGPRFKPRLGTTAPCSLQRRRSNDYPFK